MNKYFIGKTIKFKLEIQSKSLTSMTLFTVRKVFSVSCCILQSMKPSAKRNLNFPACAIAMSPYF